MECVVGIDIGGTCSDGVVVDDRGQVALGKAFSTPPDFSTGILASIQVAADELGLELSELLTAARLFLHSTTVAENAVIDGTLAAAGLVPKGGFGERLFAIGGG